MLAAKLTQEWERVSGRSYDHENPRMNYPYVIVCRNGGLRNERGAGLGAWMSDLDYVIEEWEGTLMGRDGDFAVMSSENQSDIFYFCFDWCEWDQFTSLERAMKRWMEYTNRGRTWKDAHSHKFADHDPYHPDPLLVAESRRRFLSVGWQTYNERMPLVLWEDLVSMDNTMPEGDTE